MRGGDTLVLVVQFSHLYIMLVTPYTFRLFFTKKKGIFEKHFFWTKYLAHRRFILRSLELVCTGICQHGTLFSHAVDMLCTTVALRLQPTSLASFSYAQPLQCLPRETFHPPVTLDHPL